jgi:hypothetical protein
MNTIDRSELIKQLIEKNKLEPKDGIFPPTDEVIADALVIHVIQQEEIIKKLESIKEEMR